MVPEWPPVPRQEYARRQDGRRVARDGSDSEGRQGGHACIALAAGSTAAVQAEARALMLPNPAASLQSLHRGHRTTLASQRQAVQRRSLRGIPWRRANLTAAVASRCSVRQTDSSTPSRPCSVVTNVQQPCSSAGGAGQPASQPGVPAWCPLCRRGPAGHQCRAPAPTHHGVPRSTHQGPAHLAAHVLLRGRLRGELCVSTLCLLHPYKARNARAPAAAALAARPRPPSASLTGVSHSSGVCFRRCQKKKSWVAAVPNMPSGVVLPTSSSSAA